MSRILHLITLLVFLAASAARADVGITDEADRLVLRNDRLTLALSKAEKGAIISLVDTATAAELCARQAAPRLFLLTFSDKTKPGGERFGLSSRDAATFQARVENGKGRSVVTLEYRGLGTYPVRVVCTASVAEGDPLVRWRLSAEFPEPLLLEGVQFPFCALQAPLGGDVEDDAAVLGTTKGGVHRRPGDFKQGTRLSGRQPGSLAAQFACYYDARAGFYTAAYDAKGYPKDVEMRRTAEGIEADWNPHCCASGSYSLDYDVVLSTFRSADGTSPADWRDAADIYKVWALKQPWCARTYGRRDDIPRWMKAGPAMVRFSRSWLADTKRARKWLTDYWAKHFAGVPLVTAYWGWEKHESWVTPDYFPLYPSDKEFTDLVAWSRKMGCHAFPWPSGYHWTTTFQKQEDGSFVWDDRARFDQVGRAHAIYDRAGQLYLRKPSWLRGGETACLCPGDPWTLDFWNGEICVPLARRGAELIQVDQVVGGSFPFCYSTAHGHAPGPGPWMTEVFARQLRTQYAACRKIEPDSVVCYEEPNERFNHLAGIQDYRDCEARTEWASVFNYLYHEYLPTFQSNPRGGDVPMAAYCLVNGQMPHFVPAFRSGPGPSLVNGDFEEWSGTTFGGWDQVREYQGRVWNGRFSRDTAERHGGEASMCLENKADTDVVQVSQNVPVGGGFAVGRRYRLSAWLRTETLAQPNSIGFATFTSAVKGTGAGGRLAFPAAGAGWTRLSDEFTVPEGTQMLRIMCHVERKAKVWVDDMTLEEVLPDGRTATAMRPEVPPEHALMKRWVALYHGEGRPYLLLGRMLHPPKLETQTIAQRSQLPAALVHNAYRAPDGSEAVVIANTTDVRQTGRLFWKGREIPVDLPAGDARLVR